MAFLSLQMENTLQYGGIVIEGPGQLDTPAGLCDNTGKSYVCGPDPGPERKRVDRTTHEEYLRQQGYLIVSPVTGSMRPMIRPNRDTVLMVPRTGTLRRLDVCLYREGNRLILHRAIRPAGNGCWLIRGDRNEKGEIVAEDRVFAVMQAFYRDERQIGRRDLLYRAYSVCITAMNPCLGRFLRTRRLIRRAARRLRSLPFPIRFRTQRPERRDRYGK